MNKIAILGSGNWGSAIAKIIGENVKAQPKLFHPEVRMWVHEEDINGRKLTEIINTEHENIKYLKDIKLPENIIADPDPVSTVTGANLLVFVLPHQFVENLCEKIKNVVKPNSYGISLIKGMLVKNSKPLLISQHISSALKINVSILSGANIAELVAKGPFSETTIGFNNPDAAHIFKKLFHCELLSVGLIRDIAGVELCGSLKNIVALGAGFVDGLGLGGNAKAAVIRIGLEESKRFATTFFRGVKQKTFFESCGVGDLVVTAFSGRNRKVAAEFVKQKKSWAELEKEMLNGQKLQGTLTAKEIYEILEKRKLTEKFPLFTAVYQISFEGRDPITITEIGSWHQHGKKSSKL
eukprot:TRINITY_DN11025_c0_g1_i1.p1 TRINITY_DN11025_c0_g1~~TRINITY_DN11025_c0_g1_i1.p1  ORF type:complete len:396 (+),score=70.78 TRINITY_DN11025_c0_g1_i1:131-1189(+)